MESNSVVEVQKYMNEVMIEFDAVSTNESFARVAVAAFLTPLNPTVEEIADVSICLEQMRDFYKEHGVEEMIAIGYNAIMEQKDLILQITKKKQKKKERKLWQKIHKVKAV